MLTEVINSQKLVEMVEKVDIAISAFAMCAVSMIALRGEFHMFKELELCLVLVAAYLVLMHFRPKEPRKETSVGKQHSIETEPDASNSSKQVALMKRYALESNISGVMRAFRSIQQSGERLDSTVYNTVLQAHIDCGNIHAAEDFMNQIKEAGMVDVSSFHILIKAFVAVRLAAKAEAILKEAISTGAARRSSYPVVDMFNDVLVGFARENHFSAACSVLEELRTQGLNPNRGTLNAIATIINSARDADPSDDSRQILAVRQILNDFEIRGETLQIKRGVSSEHEDASPPVALPLLAAAVSRAQRVNNSEAYWHEVRMTGSLTEVKAVRKTMKQLGFLDKAEIDAWPLDGHWETDHGLTVVIEGKIVRWSGQRASRLRFTQDDRRACVLRLYGTNARGQLVSTGQTLGATKTLRWDNGDVWNSYDGRAIGQDTLHSQSMTKTLRDKNEDEAHQARAAACLKCTCRQALSVPSILESTIIQFLGSNSHYVCVSFESSQIPNSGIECGPLSSDMDMDIWRSISCRHPRVGLRHCWAAPNGNVCGQQTLVNGRETLEEDFGQHMKGVTGA